MLNSMQTLNVITKGLKEEGGVFGYGYHPGTKEWMAYLEWGLEDPSSDMMGAAAYGLSNNSAAEAVQNCLEESGWLVKYSEAASIK